MRFVLAALLLILTGHGAFADQLVGDTKVPFSADRTVTWKGKDYVGKVYAAPGKQRHEQTINGFHPVVILRADRRMAYLMLPEAHIYAELAFPGAVTEKGDVSQLGRPVGSAVIAGLPASEYAVHRQGSDGSALDGKVWSTPDGIILRIDGTYAEPGHDGSHGRLELSDVRRGPQDPSLFELPPGMTKIQPEMLQSLLNLRVPKIK